MFYLVQAGASFQIVTERGNIYQTLTLPTGVTVDATIRARIAVINRKVVIANAPSVNLWMDPGTFDLYILAIPTPAAPVASASAGAGALTGVYSFKFRWVQKISGVVVNAGQWSPASNTVTLTAKKLHYVITNDAATGTSTTGKQLARTAAGGAVYFPWIDVDDNTTTSGEDDTADAALGLIPIDTDEGVNPAAGTDGMSQITLLTAWKNRLWARGSTVDLIDHARYSQELEFFSWPAENDFPINAGSDNTGITAYMPRRDVLGIATRTLVAKVIGSSPDDFDLVIVYNQVGCVAPDSVVIVRDAAYFLAADGVYRFDDSGVVCVSRNTVDPWFTTDTFFDRTQFSSAVGGWNPQTNCYELLLIPVGGTTLTRWVAMNLDNPDQWFGPHLTDAFTPNLHPLLPGDDGRVRPSLGGTDGFIYLQNQAGAQDVSGAGVPAAISSLARPGLLTGGKVNQEQFFGRLAILSRVESGGTLIVTPRVGRVQSPQQNPISYDLTLGRQIRRRLGVGAYVELTLSQSAVGEQFLCYGYEVEDVVTIGVREND